MKILNTFLILLLKIYKYGISPWIGNHCRFTPTCSEYAMLCFQKYSFGKAFLLTLKRLISCRPKGKFGYDPVP